MEQKYRNIADKIKGIREENNLSQKEFGEEIGIHQVSISQIENYMNLPSVGTIANICDKFDISLNWLVESKGEKYRKKIDPKEVIKSLFFEVENLFKQDYIKDIDIEKLYIRLLTHKHSKLN